MPNGFEITGQLEIEGALVEFERVVLPAEIRKGTRAAAKLVEQEFKARAPAKSGAMRDATVVRAIPRSRVKIGHGVKIDREKLFRLYESRYGRRPHPTGGDDEPFFYPVVQEYGDQDNEAQAPLRGALYDNETKIKHEAASAILRAVNHPKVKRKKT